VDWLSGRVNGELVGVGPSEAGSLFAPVIAVELWFSLPLFTRPTGSHGKGLT
jgi:hypothetical protein